MKFRVGLLAILSLILILRGSEAFAQDESKRSPAVTTGTLSPLKMRSIGPALMSGRIADIAIDAKQPNTWYVAAGSGNLWKTINAGTTWKPIFERYGSYSIGCIALDPSDRDTLWVGTGENVGGRHVGYGDGIYVSHDGGQTFVNKGLKNSEHLSKIIIHPEDSQTLFVASQGPLWSSGGERGLYKSTDGGATWRAVLTRGPWTGVTDVVMDPKNPNILFAATHQRHRTVYGLINGGPESGIHKSVDGGETWVELKSGLPAADKGKMSIAISPQKSNVVYAAIELAGPTGGVWRSENGGQSWSKMSDYVAGGTGPHYYQEIYCDPHRFDVFYHANVQLGRTEDGGATFNSVGNSNKHVDNHAVAFHPTDPDFLLVGCDGGLYRSWDYAETYQYTANLPLTQFYKLDVDYDLPFYNVVGGTQDNNTQYGPTRTRTVSGIRNADWRITIGGDGHDCAIDPKDPNIIYCESQEGYLRRFDRRTGESVDIKPQPIAGEEELRHNWDSPILISPHSHTRLYFGSKKLHRSEDRGDSWTEISPDLSRNQDRFQLPFMDRVWSIDGLWDLYAMSQYGNITSISESPIVEGLLYVGTDDGLIQVSEDGGSNWRSVDKIFGVPEGFFVNDIKADLHDPDTVYAVMDDHKTGDYDPYVVRSTDRGRTWAPIMGDLPKRTLVWRIIQDHVVPELMFLGTEFGIYYTRDAGEHWVKIPGTPVIPFRDLEIQRRENDLVGATFGRGFYVLDDYTPLRTLDRSVLEEKFTLFETRPAKLYIEERILGGVKGSQGDSYYTAPNPPFGAVFTFHLKEGPKTAKAERQAREAKIKAAGGDNPYPGWDALEAETREEEPKLLITIRDASGQMVNRLYAAANPGMQRVTWNLRYASMSGGRGSGPLVVPGKFTVQFSLRFGGEITDLNEPAEFEVVSIYESTLPRQDRKAVLAFQTKVGKLQRDLMGASQKLAATLEALEEIKQVVLNTPSLESSLYDRADAMINELKDLDIKLSGDTTRSSRSQTAQVSIRQRVSAGLRGTLSQTYGPTETHRQQFEIGQREFKILQKQLDQFYAKTYAALLKDLDKADAPWTPGR